MKDRIEFIIKSANIKKVDFAKRLNISQAFVSQMCSGVAMASDRTIQDICREFSVNPEWLRTGEGDVSDMLHPKVMELVKEVDIWAKE